MTVFIFWCLCFVGMFVAGVVTDWLDARSSDYMAPWADREPGDLG